MNTVAIRANRRKLLILAFLVLLCAAGYMLVEVNFSNPKLLAYAMKIRTPKLIVMLITAFRHTQLVLGSALFGMIVLVGGQLIVEHVYSYSVPVSVFITVGGGLYFLYLLLTRKKV